MRLVLYMGPVDSRYVVAKNYKILGDDTNQIYRQFRDSDYYIGENGGVYHAKLNKMLKPIKGTRYKTYRLSIGKPSMRKACLLHRLVCEVFLGEILSYNVVHHIDEHDHNNSANNLCSKPRGKHSSDHNIGKNGKKINSLNLPRPVAKYTLLGEFIMAYESLHDAIRSIKKPAGRNAISVAIEKCGIAYGYQWRYVSDFAYQIERDKVVIDESKILNNIGVSRKKRHNCIPVIAKCISDVENEIEILYPSIYQATQAIKRNKWSVTHSHQTAKPVVSAIDGSLWVFKILYEGTDNYDDQKNL